MCEYTTIEVSAEELQRRDPREFQRQYWDWVEHAYWEPEFEFTLPQWQTEHGVHVERSDISYSGFYSRGDGLAFDGRVEVQRILDQLGLQTKAPALYADVLNFGTNWLWVKRSRGYSVNFSDCVEWDYSPGNCYPSGVFVNLDQATWDTLVEAQFDLWVSDIEKAALELAQQLAGEMYSELQDDYEYCTSEESFIEHCEANEVKFEIEVEVEETPCT
jgi:hypothetical protein